MKRKLRKNRKKKKKKQTTTTTESLFRGGFLGISNYL